MKLRKSISGQNQDGGRRQSWTLLQSQSQKQQISQKMILLYSTSSKCHCMLIHY